MGGGIFDGAACLICKLTKVDFKGMRRCSEHINVGARAEDPRLEAGDHDRLNCRMLEAQALNCIRQFNIDSQIVGIEFELVPLGDCDVFLYVH